MAGSNVFTLLSHNTRERFLEVCPYSKDEAWNLTNKTLLKTYVIAFTACIADLLFCFAVDKKITVYSVACSLFILYLVVFSFPYMIVRKRKEQLLSDLMLYFAAVKRKFIYTGNIPNACLYGAEEMSTEIVKNASEIVSILLTDDRREAVRAYIADRRKNRFLKLFLIQAYETSENGDEKNPDGGSAFAANVELLRLELINEIYALKKKKYMFSGYLFVSLFPVFIFPLVRRAGISLSPELSSYYLSTGNIVIALTFIFSYFVYSVLSDRNREDFTGGANDPLGYGALRKHDPKFAAKIREAANNNNGKVFGFVREKILYSGRNISVSSVVLKCIFFFFIVFALGVLFTAIGKTEEKKALFNEITNIDSVATLAGEKLKVRIGDAILKSVKTIYEAKERPEDEDALYALAQSTFDGVMTGNTKNYRDNAAAEIVRRLKKVDGCYIHFTEYMLILITSLIFGMLPVLRLLIDSDMRKKGAIDEIKRFQSVLIMERHFKTISVTNLLTDLELFSDMFKPELRTCINSYSSGPVAALKKLKEDGVKKDKRFREIADGFLAIDDVGIYEAFSDEAGNRECLEKMYELEKQMSSERKKEIVDIIAWIPACLVVFGYFVAPFVKTSLTELEYLFEVMEHAGI